jgi:hypothetical protein
MSEIRPIDRCVERWHDFLRGNLDGGLESLLHEDVVFLSPIVFTPQRGRAITAAYLSAAGATLGGDAERPKNDERSDRSFRYVKHVVDGNHAVLEFVTWIGDTEVNGVDIITCDDEGSIVEFKVMIRPLKAVNAVHEQMRRALEAAGTI